MGVSRHTVRAAIASDAPPKCERKPSGSIVDEIAPRIRELLQSYPRMPATVIAERIGWNRGLTVSKELVAELRPVYLPPDPAGRTNYVAGEIAQRDLCSHRSSCRWDSARSAAPTLLPPLATITADSRWRCCCCCCRRTIVYAVAQDKGNQVAACRVALASIGDAVATIPPSSRHLSPD